MVVDINNGGRFKDRVGTKIVIIKAHCPLALATTTSNPISYYFITGKQVAYQDSMSLQQPTIRLSSLL